jgi:hypothetical protein
METDMTTVTPLRPLPADLDVCAVVEGLRQGFEAMRVAARRAGEVIARAGVVFRAAANDEVRVCGLEGRFQVRGAFADDVDALIHDLLRCPETLAAQGESLYLGLLTPANRARLAAAAARGHAEHVVTAAPGHHAWHRLLGDTAVVVTRGQ